MPKLPGNILSKQTVEQRQGGHQWQRPTNHAPRCFQYHQEQRYRHCKLKIAFEKPILVPEHVAVEGHPKRCSNAQSRKETSRYTAHWRIRIKDQGEGENEGHMQRPADEVRHQTGKNQSQMISNQRDSERDPETRRHTALGKVDHFWEVRL